MKRRKAILGYICAALVLACHGGFSAAVAHPHVWVTVETEILYGSDKSLQGFRHKWTFDEFYSSFAVQGLDKNGDGTYDREELSELAEVNITSLNEFEYFTFPKLAGKVLERLEPKDYWLEYNGTQLTLHLTLPLAKTVASDQVKDLALGIYDPTFYVDFSLAAENPVRLAGAPSGCKPVVADPDPQDAQLNISNLGEAFFDNFDASSTEAEKYAKKISISCSAS